MPVVAPVVAMPVAIAADPARAVIGPDHPALAVRVVIIGGRVEEPPVETMAVHEAKAAATENMSRTKPATVEHGAAGSESTDMDGPAAATVETTASTASSPATAAAMAADFGRQSVRDMFCRGRRTRIDQRQRFRALARHSGEYKYRGRREPERPNKAPDQATPGIQNFHHT
jgi:hypothetical protein